MAIPIGTYIWPEALDPSDVVDYTIDCEGLFDDPAENIYSYTLELSPEAIFYGLMLEDPPTYNIELSPDRRSIKVWLQIEDPQENHADFRLGVTLPIEVTFVTNAIQARIRQRTVAVKVIQR